MAVGVKNRTFKILVNAQECNYGKNVLRKSLIRKSFLNFKASILSQLGHFLSYCYFSSVDHKEGVRSAHERWSLTGARDRS